MLSRNRSVFKLWKESKDCQLLVVMDETGPALRQWARPVRFFICKKAVEREIFLLQSIWGKTDWISVEHLRVFSLPPPHPCSEQVSTFWWVAPVKQAERSWPFAISRVGTSLLAVVRTVPHHGGIKFVWKAAATAVGCLYPDSHDLPVSVSPYLTSLFLCSRPKRKTVSSEVLLFLVPSECPEG
jgi:hypothetical protein